jgi:hypothetical protein
MVLATNIRNSIIILITIVIVMAKIKNYLKTTSRESS